MVYFFFDFGKFLKQLVNFVITGAVLYVASRAFPSVVIIDGWGALILATLLLSIAEFIVAIAVLALMFISVFTQNWAGVVVGFIALFFGGIIALSLLSAWIPGFMVVGFWPKFMLAFALSALRVPDDDKR